MRNTFERILILQHDPLKTQFRCLCLHALRDFQQVLPSTAAKKGVWWLWQIPTQCVLLGTPSGDRGSYLDSGALSQLRYWQLKKQAFLQACGSFPPVFTIRSHGQWLSVWTCIWVARTHIKSEAAAHFCAPTTHGALTGQLSWCVHWWTRILSWSWGRWAHTQIFA